MDKAKSILVLDDEKDLVEALNGFFTAKGYKMFATTSSKEALKILKQTPPKLILLDMKMPGMDGIAVLKHVKGQYPDTKVIVLTGHQEEYKPQVDEIGAEGLIAKPFTLNDLTERIDDVLAERLFISKDIFVLFKDEYVLPKARLLFVEPGSSTLEERVAYFSDSKRCGGDYGIKSVAELGAVLKGVNEFKTDIVLGDISMFGSSNKLFSEIMALENKPKDVIVYGHILDHMEGEKLKEGGFKPQTVTLDKADIDKLGKMVRETAISNNLYIESKNKVYIPGRKDRDTDREKALKAEKIAPENIPDAVKEIVVKQLKIETDKLTPDLKIKEIVSTDSLEFILLMTELEEIFGIEISDEESDRVVSLKNITALVTEKLKK